MYFITSITYGIVWPFCDYNYNYAIASASTTNHVSLANIPVDVIVRECVCVALLYHRTQSTGGSDFGTTAFTMAVVHGDMPNES